MKRMWKFVVMIMLLAILTPCYDGSAENTAEIDGKSVLSYTLPEDWPCDDPYSYLYSNNPSAVERLSQQNARTGIAFSINDIDYVYRTSIRTTGQRAVPVYAASRDFTDIEKETYMQDTLERYPTIVMLEMPTSLYNCHSYAWYSQAPNNSFWIKDVETYADDLHTVEIESISLVRPGDILLYKDGMGGYFHSAIITEVGSRGILCVSKWGQSVLCEHLWNEVPREYAIGGIQLECIIMRKMPHSWNYEETGAAQHTRICTICGYEETSNCNYTYTYLYDDMHNGRCADCGGIIPGGFCSFTTTSNGDGTHTATCDACNHANTENCQLEYTEISDTHHAMKCRKCAYILSSAPCAFYYTSKGDGTHTKACNVCGQEQMGTAETCTYVYKSNGNNTHSRVCKDCGHLNSGPAVCVFKSDDKCRFCGGVKDSAVINSLEAELGEE